MQLFYYIIPARGGLYYFWCAKHTWSPPLSASNTLRIVKDQLKMRKLWPSKVKGVKNSPKKNYWTLQRLVLKHPEGSFYVVLLVKSWGLKVGGVQRKKRKTKRFVTWKDFVESCDVCARINNLHHHHPHGFLQPLLIHTSLWSSISMSSQTFHLLILLTPSWWWWIVWWRWFISFHVLK